MGNVLSGTQPQKLAYAKAGAGPLLQRDYVGVIQGTDWTPEDLAKQVREGFIELAPSETAAFERSDDEDRPLAVGHVLKIRIGGFLPCQVRVVHVDSRSLTLRTLDGHPEAGRITFGAGRDEQDRLTFRICSRARAGGLIHYLGFLLIGRTMQARCWIRFIGRVAGACGGRLTGPVRVRTSRVEEEAADCGGPECPTFSCGTGA